MSPSRTLPPKRPVTQIGSAPATDPSAGTDFAGDVAGIMGTTRRDVLRQFREAVKAITPKVESDGTVEHIRVGRGSKTFLTLNGIRMRQGAWAKRLGIRPATLQYRIANGWSVREALGL